MNILNRKLHFLEKNVLPELPEEGTTRITWDNGDAELNEAENELHRRATQILQYHADELQAAKERGDTAYNPLSIDDHALVDAANRRFTARILEIFQVFTDAFVTYKDPMANWVFYTRFYWLIEETRKFKEQYDAEEEVFNTPGYWELCEGEQERRLAPVYAAWNHNLFTPESFQHYCDRHHVFKTTEDIQQFIANRTPEQAKQDELEKQQEENEEKAAKERNARYLKEKCPTCAEPCDRFKKNAQNVQINQLPPTENEIKAWLHIEKFLIQLKNDGRKNGTILNCRKSFKRLLQDGADLFDPESTKAALAKSTLKESTKKTVTGVLGTWFAYNQISWRVPKYSDENEIPYIPTENEIDLLIAALGRKNACFCQLLKETGARCGEIAELDWLSIDWEQRKVRIKAEKGSNSRILPLSAKAIEMVSKLPRTNRNPKRKNKIFANSDDMRSSFFLQKRRIAERQANPKLMLIHFHTFRHWKATTEQHKTKDPWHVKMILGHKSIKSTENYIHLEQMMYDGDANDQFTVKVANTMEEAIKLMEVGFEYHAEIEGNKLFRKRK